MPPLVRVLEKQREEQVRYAMEGGREGGRVGGSARCEMCERTREREMWEGERLQRASMYVKKEGIKTNARRDEREMRGERCEREKQRRWEDASAVKQRD